jgi:hypothetical protein
MLQRDVEKSLMHSSAFPSTTLKKALSQALGSVPLRFSAQDFASASLFFFLILTTISLATTSSVSRVVIEGVRGISLSGMLLCIALSILYSRGLRLTTLTSLLIMYCLLFYGMFLAVLNGGFETSLLGLPIDLFLITMGILILSLQDGTIISKRMASRLLWYSGFVLLITVATGGMRLSVPPSFNFEYLSHVQGGEVRYSQGMSKFFGISAVCAVFLAFEHKTMKERSGYYLLAISFVLLSFLGGSRGDSLAIAVLLMGYTLYKAPHYIIYVVSVGFFVPLFLSRIIDLENIVIVSRLLALKDNLGMRDVLLRDVILLLENRPICLLQGCGYDYFQAHFRYNAGLYPHNYVAESIIVFGIPLSATLFSLAFYGLYISRSVHSAQPDAYPMIFIFLIIIGLKGGSLNSDWVLTSGLVFFATIAIVHPYGRRYGSRKQWAEKPARTV